MTCTDVILGTRRLVEILHDADSADRQEVYRQLGLRLTYDPGKQEIRVEVNLHPDQLVTVRDRYYGVTVRVRGGNEPVSPKPITFGDVLSFAARN
ncbi:MAG: recombinase family protein [Actinomycetia bacterium]|nr:recombinase family protein [Actinomycetes bacterium]